MASQDTSDSFVFPAYYSFPPFFTPQPNTNTRLSQLRKWSALIRAYCRHHKIYRLSLVDVDSPLFYNSTIQKRLSLAEARNVIDWMCREEGDRRAEWIGPTGNTNAKVTAYIWWRRPEEWATIIYEWVCSLLLAIWSLPVAIVVLRSISRSFGHLFNTLCRLSKQGRRRRS